MQQHRSHRWSCVRNRNSKREGRIVGALRAHSKTVPAQTVHTLMALLYISRAQRRFSLAESHVNLALRLSLQMFGRRGAAVVL